jgi:hypothetical protein
MQSLTKLFWKADTGTVVNHNFYKILKKIKKNFESVLNCNDPDR